MRVRLLGPVDVLVDGAVREVRGRRLQAALAALALQHGEIVSTDRLCDLVWGDNPPNNAAATLQNHMSRLRTVLGSRAAILARSPGYVLNLGRAVTDVQEAQQLIDHAGKASDLAVREEMLQAAVALWRGRPLAELAGLVRFDEQARRLEQLLLRARLNLVDTRLALGQHGQLIGELAALTAEQPLNEQVNGQLMVALYRSGRQADALQTFQRLRGSLATELGVDPSSQISDLHTAILRHDPTLAAPAPSPPVPAEIVPAQLPRALPGFTGRSGEIERLDAVLATADGPRPAVVVSAIGGTAGVGKTTLAVHWAHRVADRFPHGQLYVNMRGFDTGPPMTPAEAVRGFLDALGVPVERIPDGLDAQTALYRSLLAGKKVLVVLDNAATAEQVRPLLPGTPGCLVVVTSRNRLASLVAADGALPMTLDLLTADEARDLLAARLGEARVAAEPAAVDEIVARCARLPLALAMAAAHAVTDPHCGLAQLAGQLRRHGGGLDAFDGDDPATQVRAVFSWSYRQLSTEAARLFRLLGVHCGPDVSACAVASLGGVIVDRLRPALAELVRAHLLTQLGPDRFAQHDLLRAYAAELSEMDPERQPALHRMLDHYLHTGSAAALQLDPQRGRLPLPERLPGVSTEDIQDADEALAWYAAEHRVLVAALRCAELNGFHAHVWGLAWTLVDFLKRRGHWQEMVDIQRAGLGAAMRAGDRMTQAGCHRWLANALITVGDLNDATVHLGQALDLAHEAGDHFAQAQAYAGLALVLERQGHYRQARGHVERAFAMYEITGDLGRQATALNDLGWLESHLGEHRLALTHCERAIGLLQQLGGHAQQANTWNSLGYIHRQLGDLARSADCYWRAIELHRQTGDRYHEADTYNSLGAMHHASGDFAAARTAWQYALDLFVQLGHSRADEVHAHLDAE